jgi:hypothetical protein
VEVTEITSGRTTRDWGLQSVIGTIPQLAQKLVFCNSDLDKSTTFCKVGDLEVFVRCTPVRCTPCEVHAYEIHTLEMHVL